MFTTITVSAKMDKNTTLILGRSAGSRMFRFNELDTVVAEASELVVSRNSNAVIVSV